MDIKTDLIFAQITGEQFDDYVHTEVLFYPIGSVSGLAMPQLTIGAWLEAAWRLRAMESTLTAEQRSTFDTAKASVQRVRGLWTSLYQQKAQREFRSRLDSWSWYLDDLLNKTGNISSQASAYLSQVHIRFKLELLRQDTSHLSDQLARLDVSDRRLRVRFVAGDFVWEPELQPAAPRDVFWFLYGQPH